MAEFIVKEPSDEVFLLIDTDVDTDAEDVPKLVIKAKDMEQAERFVEDFYDLSDNEENFPTCEDFWERMMLVGPIVLYDVLSEKG